ncbi:MAG: molybdopterin-dependent oxidoreductase [Candidatus Woesearchaeota archaeon]|jgi:DMSO/TMAO reductase YedYZ molybdopterin-dependent catalytic subunit
MLESKKIIFVVVIFATLFLAGCVSQEIKSLQSVEVREYKGEKLSSIGDFRENSIKGPQYVNVTNYKLYITGLVENPKSYTYDEILNHRKYTKVVKLNCVEGWSVNILWEGVKVKDLIESANISSKANTIIFYAYDGYSTSFPLKYVLDNDIILAYKMNNVTIPPERGYPFQLVAESKWGYKWIKWVTDIQLSNDENYTGYWEQRGYSDSGDLNKGFLK